VNCPFIFHFHTLQSCWFLRLHWQKFNRIYSSTTWPVKFLLNLSTNSTRGPKQPDCLTETDLLILKSYSLGKFLGKEMSKHQVSDQKKQFCPFPKDTLVLHRKESKYLKCFSRRQTSVVDSLKNVILLIVHMIN